MSTTVPLETKKIVASAVLNSTQELLLPFQRLISTAQNKMSVVAESYSAKKSIESGSGSYTSDMKVVNRFLGDGLAECFAADILKVKGQTFTPGVCSHPKCTKPAQTDKHLSFCDVHGKAVAKNLESEFIHKASKIEDSETKRVFLKSWNEFRELTWSNEQEAHSFLYDVIGPFVQNMTTASDQMTADLGQGLLEVITMYRHLYNPDFAVVGLLNSFMSASVATFAELGCSAAAANIISAAIAASLLLPVAILIRGLQTDSQVHRKIGGAGMLGAVIGGTSGACGAYLAAAAGIANPPLGACILAGAFVGSWTGMGAAALYY